jgi:hypothetical protein
VPGLWSHIKRAAVALTRLRSSAGEELPEFARSYERIFRTLSREELYEEEAPDVEQELAQELFDRRHRSHHFLGAYSAKGGRLAFERYGFFNLLRERGFDPVLSLDLADPDDHKLRIHDGVQDAAHLLIELSVGFRDVELPDGTSCRLLFIGWLLMQDPGRTFEPERPRLPDQEHPGLGLFPHFGYLLKLIAVRLGCDGLLNHPSHFHNAVLYGKFFQFLDPAAEGRFRALERDLRELSLAEATLRVREGQVLNASGEVFKWEPSLQVAPLTPRAKRWFSSDEYLATMARARDGSKFRLACT